MFILRGLFWFGVVALLMPQSPDLGLSRPLDALRDALAAQQSMRYPIQAVERSRNRASKPRAKSIDFVEDWRQAAYARVDLVRAELAADRTARNGKLAELITLPPRY